MAKTTINSPRLKDAPGATRMVKAGNQIYLQLFMPVDDDTKQIMYKGDMESQARRCLDRIKIALEDAGASLDALVQLTIYTLDMSRNIEFFQVRKEYFPHGGVATVAVEVKGLNEPGALVAMTGIAVVD